MTTTPQAQLIAREHPYIQMPDPYGDDPHALCPPNVGGQPSLGTERPVRIVEETIHAAPVATEDGEIALAPERESDEIASAERRVQQKIDRLPKRADDTFPTLFAWYGNFGMAENYRSVMAALCAELVRAKFAARNEKISEARIEDLSRCEDAYMGFLAEHLHGRERWAKECLSLGETPK